MQLKKSCLFIDNDLFNHIVFKEALKDVSPETTCYNASNGADALRIMELENILPSCIFLEVDSVRFDGVGFLRSIKRIDRFKTVPVIAHATRLLPNEIIEIKESGAFAIYFRPYEYYSVCNMLQLCFVSPMAGIQPN